MIHLIWNKWLSSKKKAPSEGNREYHTTDTAYHDSTDVYTLLHLKRIVTDQQTTEQIDAHESEHVMKLSRAMEERYTTAGDAEIYYHM